MKQPNELTVRAVTVGVLLSLAMAAANTYLGLKAGMTIAANIPCSVIAILLFHTVMRARSLGEINVTQSTGSVGEGLAAGVIFVVPALVLSGVYKPFAEWGVTEHATVTLAVLAGSVVGVVLTGFLRQPMVVESKELRYPEGVATAEVIKTGSAALGEGRREGLGGVGLAFLGGVLVKTLSGGVAILADSVSFAVQAGGAAIKLGSDLSAALVGVGFIIEFSGALLVALGGALAWLVFIPIVSAMGTHTGSAADIADAVWADQVRYIGVGGMIVGGLWSIVQIRRQLAAGIRAAVAGLRKSAGVDADKNPDLSRRTIVGLLALGLLLTIGVYFASVGAVGALIASLYTLVAVFFFVAISVYVVGLLGSSNQPVSGITICTFLLAAVFLLIGRIGGPEGVKSVLLISTVVCLAACLSGTAAQNFKTAMAVGGSPRAVSVGMLIAVVATSFLATPLLVFLDKAFVIGSKELLAPQAGMFSAMAKGLFIEGGTLPWNMVFIGMGLAVGLVLMGEVLRRRGSTFGVSPMAVAVGIYLPFSTTLPILLGGLVHYFVVAREKDPTRQAAAMQRGTVLCAAIVAGEALTGIGLAVPVGLGAKLPYEVVESGGVRSVLALATLVAVPLLLALGARQKSVAR